MTETLAQDPSSLLPSTEQRLKRRKTRKLRDGISRFGITAAGYGVVFSLVLIFIYLFYEVIPVFRSASLTQTQSYELPADFPASEVATLSIERFRQVAAAISDKGEFSFFSMADGAPVSKESIPLPEGRSVTSFARGEEISNRLAYGLDNGTAIVVDHDYDVSFPDDVRTITPKLLYPFGEAPIELDPEGASITHLAVQKRRGSTDEGLLIGHTEDGRLVGAHLTTREDMFSGEVETQISRFTLPTPDHSPKIILAEKTFRSVFIADQQGRVHYYDIRNQQNVALTASYDVAPVGGINSMEFLVGTVSLAIGTGDGRLLQWFLVRDDENNFSLQSVRAFEPHELSITNITTEKTRKGFVSMDAQGTLGIHYGTSARTLLMETIDDHPLLHVAMPQSPRNMLTLNSEGTVGVYDLWNEHPQVSFRALWNKVWYEGRQDPEYIWQSGSASDEFESKFSLIPLSVGTLKAAFFAMLFAMPLGLLGAIYTAYFMSPKLRGTIKPTIEIMEALPTVILGFLAGLWLAPFMENNLPAVFSILIGMPLAILATAALWQFVPKAISLRIPTGWEVAILLPVLLFLGWFLVTMSPYVEVWFFNGSMRQWLTDNGITYDQRNAMVVGVAMGFAVIPTIYSIAEDSVFNVPKHLTQGSLALGATSWQTVVGVVLPTASPGMFSAVMIGFGRAIGETMIVLMATGNSPIVNFNIFEGMRTLSANIAVELPETAVGSSHFRILFLAALVLFILTFILNTIAEVVRQRLRRRYSSL